MRGIVGAIQSKKKSARARIEARQCLAGEYPVQFGEQREYYYCCNVKNDFSSAGSLGLFHPRVDAVVPVASEHWSSLEAPTSPKARTRTAVGSRLQNICAGWYIFRYRFIVSAVPLRYRRLSVLHTNSTYKRGLYLVVSSLSSIVQFPLHCAAGKSFNTPSLRSSNGVKTKS